MIVQEIVKRLVVLAQRLHHRLVDLIGKCRSHIDVLVLRLCRNLQLAALHEDRNDHFHDDAILLRELARILGIDLIDDRLQLVTPLFHDRRCLGLRSRIGHAPIPQFDRS